MGLVGIGAIKNAPGAPHEVHFVEEKHAVAPPLIYLKVSEANIYGEKYWIPFLELNFILLRHAGFFPQGEAGAHPWSRHNLSRVTKMDWTKPFDVPQRAKSRS